MSTRSESGFSLLEIMVVVAIIGILATLAVPNLIDYSKRTVAKQQLQVIAANIASLRIREDGPNGMVPLAVISTSYCAWCEGGLNPGQNPKVLLTSARYKQIWANLGYDKIPLDPWGNPLILNENDEEFALPFCMFDAIQSAGPNQIWEMRFGDDIQGDDIGVWLPTIRRPCVADAANGGHL